MQGHRGLNGTSLPESQTVLSLQNMHVIYNLILVTLVSNEFC